MGNTELSPWMRGLDVEDFAFIRRFILASGSLKQVASVYGVSYPTVRLRLDRLIAKIEVWESYQKRSEFERLLRATYAEGKIDALSFSQLLNSYLKEGSESHDDHIHEPGLK